MIMQNPLLVIIDVQEKLFPVIHERNVLEKQLSILVQGFQLFEQPIIYTEQTPDKLGPTIKPLSQFLLKHSCIEKTTFSCMDDDTFRLTLGEIDFDSLILAGIETHICIYQTANDLVRNGYDVEVVADAVSSRYDINKNVGLERIRDVGAKLTTVELLLFYLQKKAVGNRFKKLIKLVK